MSNIISGGTVCGGVGAPKPANEEVQKIVDDVITV
jgi:hypothetical protein